MSGTANNRWTLRLSTEGADQVIRDLRAAATESAAAGRAYDALLKAQPALATGAERAEGALRKNVDAMRAMRGELGLLGSAAEGAAGSLGRLGSALSSPAAAMAALGAGAVAAGVSIAKLGDEYTVTINKLRAATGSIGSAQAVYGELVALSQQTGAAISDSASAFVRFSVAARSIGATNGEVLQLTRTIQQAGLMAGGTTQETASGVQQLGQALASGKLQGDELRSILENMPTLAEALARELGVSIGQLRQMGSEGQLTSDRVFQALLRAGEQINKQFAELTPTMGQAFGILGQAMVDFVGKLDRALGLSQGIAAAARAAASVVSGAGGAITPRSPAEQAAFDEQQAEARRARIEAEISSLSGEAMGPPAPPRRGTIGRGLQETAAQARPAEERLAELRERLAAEDRVLAEARERRANAERDADEVRQAEEATARARREAAARAETAAAGQSLRERNKSEQDLRREHAERIATIERNRLQGNFDQAEASRQRAAEERKLAEEIRNLREAERGRIATDEELVAVGRIVADVEKDRQALMREGETVTASVRTEAEKYAEQLSVLRTLLEQGAITQDTFNRAVAAADPAARAATEAARRLEQDNTRTTDRIVGFFGDSFARAFENTGKGFAGLMESFKRGAISTFATIAAQAIIRPIVAPIVSSLGLGQLAAGGGGLGGLLGFGGTMGGPAGVADPGSTQGAINQAGQAIGLRTAGNFGNLGQAFTGQGLANTGVSWLDGALNTSLTSPTLSSTGYLGAGGVPIVDGSAGLSVAGGIGGAAGILGGAYGIYSGLQRGGPGGYTSAAGGLLSAGLGAATLAGLTVPGIGWAVAAGLAIAGALMPGQQASGRGQLARVDLGRGDQSFDGLGGDRFSQGNRDAAANTVSSIADLTRQIGQRLGGARIGGTASVGVTSSRGSGPGTLYIDINGRRDQFANDEAGSKQLAETAARFILEEFKSQGAAQGDFAGILAGSGSLEALQSNLDWYEQTYKTLGKVGQATSAYEQQLEALTKPYDDAISKARELSLSEEALSTRRAEAVAKAEAARDAQLATIRDTLSGRSIEAGLSGGNVVQLADAIRLRGEARSAAQELEGLRQELTDLGLSTGEVSDAVARLAQIQTSEAAKRAEEVAYSRNLTAAGIMLGIEERAAAVSGQGEAAASIAARQRALAATDELRKLQQELTRLGVSSEEAAAWVSTLSQVQTQEARRAEEEAAAARQAVNTVGLRDEAARSALGVVTSLRSYTASLSSTGAGAGTALDRLAASQRQFDAIFGSAAAGDASSIAGLQGAAEIYRAAAREVFGGGQGFADAIRLIEERISSIGNLGAETLTQSFMAENARANTDRIVDQLAKLRADINMLLMRPAA